MTNLGATTTAAPAAPCPWPSYGEGCAHTGAKDDPAMHYVLIAIPGLVALYVFFCGMEPLLRVLAVTKLRVPTSPQRWGLALVSVGNRSGLLA